jgi:uncharacterized glyoxalase superfamily protein PhnB
MSTQKKDPRGLPNRRWLMPYLTVVDAEKSVEFYKKAFGFILVDSNMEEGKMIHAEMEYQGKLIVMFAVEGAFGSALKSPKTLGIEMPSSFYLYVDNVDYVAYQVEKAGGKIVTEPEDSFWGDRFALIKDIDGYTWSLGTYIEPVHHHHHHDGVACNHQH